MSERLYFYYSTTNMENLLKMSKSHLCSALLKHGHSNFSLTILEYCEPEQCLEREYFYLSSLNHEYNIEKKMLELYLLAVNIPACEAGEIKQKYHRRDAKNP